MKKPKKIPALLAVQPVVGRVSGGRVTNAVPVGPEQVIDAVEIEMTDSSEITVRSTTSGASVTLGFEPSYANRWDRAFGSAKSSDN